MRSGIGPDLKARERRTIAAGATLVALALLVTAVVLPFVRRWSEREARIEVTRDRLSRLSAISGREDELRQSLGIRNARLDAGGVRLLHARTSALAASALQGMVREQARRSSVAVTRMDVAGTTESAATSAVPATISAVGDIYGVAQFLQLLQHGPSLLDVRDVSISSNSALGRGLLQLSLTVHAPFVSGQ